MDGVNLGQLCMITFFFVALDFILHRYLFVDVRMLYAAEYVIQFDSVLNLATEASRFCFEKL